MNKTKNPIDYLLFCVAGTIAGVLSYHAADWFKPPAIEIRSSTIIEESARPGDIFAIRNKYFKNRDCVGTWEFRAILPSGKVVILDRINGKTGKLEQAHGALGTSPPGQPYEYVVELQVPVTATPGTMRVTELDVCNGEPGIMRSPVATIEVLPWSDD